MCELYDGPEHLRYRCTHGSRDVGSNSDSSFGMELVVGGSYILENRIGGYD